MSAAAQETETPEQDTQETEAPATETPEPSTEPETEVAAANEDETEGAEPAEGTPEADKTESKRKGGFQRKIERLEREKDILYQQLLQRSGQPPQTPPADGKPKAPEEQVQEYVSGLVAKQLAEERAREQQAKAHAELQRRTAEVRASLPDFDEVLASVGHVYVSPAVQQALLTSEQGPAIMYQLASNPDELARLSALPPFEAAREIGRLEAKASVAPSPKAGRPVVTAGKSAPAPISPVKARGPTQTKGPGQQSYEEYAAAREAELRGKR